MPVARPYVHHTRPSDKALINLLFKDLTIASVVTYLVGICFLLVDLATGSGGLTTCLNALALLRFWYSVRLISHFVHVGKHIE